MRTILFVFSVSFCLHICCGRYRGLVRYSTNRLGVSLRELSQSDEKCSDDPYYATECEKMARYERWCSDQKEHIKDKCAKSCKFCEETVEPSTEPKAPAPIECSDDPYYATECEKMARYERWCSDQKEHIKDKCAKSCKFCEETVEPSTEPKAPAPAVTVCEDDPDYASGCPKYAAIKNYCGDQEAFMRKHCKRSCKFCTEEETVLPSTEPKPPAPTEETVKPSTEPKPPAPAVCEDNPKWASKCPEWAAKGSCDKALVFMKEYCKKSCNFSCEPEETVEPSTEPKPPAPTETVEPSTEPKPPAPAVCEDNPKWASKCPEWAAKGSCDKALVFMKEYCKKSCNFPCEPEPTSNPETKPPSPPAFCRDRDVNCQYWKDKGDCEDPLAEHNMKVYCAVTCGFCKAPTPEECYDKIDYCQQLKKNGDCSSTLPEKESQVKTNCLETCEFCVPDLP